MTASKDTYRLAYAATEAQSLADSFRSIHWVDYAETLQELADSASRGWAECRARDERTSWLIPNPDVAADVRMERLRQWITANLAEFEEQVRLLRSP